jgi:uncharacterized protein YdeI (YjbR/CyaY-like superfamily)
MKAKQVGEVPEPKVPADLSEALHAAPLAEAAWDDLTPLARRDFISWIDTAKQAETRSRRIQRCCENLVAGKRRPCCFAVVPMDFYRALGSDPGAKAKWDELTSTERRDLTDWIEEAKEREDRKRRVAEACAMLEAGEPLPK